MIWDLTLWDRASGHPVLAWKCPLQVSCGCISFQSAGSLHFLTVFSWLVCCSAFTGRQLLVTMRDESVIRLPNEQNLNLVTSTDAHQLVIVWSRYIILLHDKSLHRRLLWKAKDLPFVSVISWCYMFVTLYEFGAKTISRSINYCSYLANKLIVAVIFLSKNATHSLITAS